MKDLRWIYIIVLILLVLVLYLGFGILWIGSVLVFCSVIYLLFKVSRRLHFNRIVSQVLVLLRSSLVVMLIFLAGITIRLLFFEIYAIPSSSMESALFPGDKIIVNKLGYGPQLPQTPFEIPWLNIFFYLNAESPADKDAEWWDYHRLQGFSKIRAGDVLVFYKHHNKNVPFVKRCMAGPGEQFQVVDGGRADMQEAKWLSTALMPVQIWTKDPRSMKKFLDSIEIVSYSTSFWQSSEPTFQVRVPQCLIPNLRTLPITDSLKLKPEVEEIRSHYLLSMDSSWTIYNFGPITVPSQGMLVTLNSATYDTYSNLIRQFEGIDIVRQEGAYFIEGKEVKHYTFKNNYYWMMGDNREDSNDSRYSGFITEQNIIGRADLVLFSYRYGKFDYERFLKPL